MRLAHGAGVALLAAAACGTSSAPADGPGSKAAVQEAASAADGTAALPGGVAVPNPGVAEPSGIAYHPGRQRLYVVGDEGSLAELDAEGRFVASTALGENLEDVAVHEPSGGLVLLDEANGELLVFDPESRRTVSRWRLDAAALVGQKEKGRDGFEGLGFKPEAGRPGGGVFYLAHQRGPAVLVAVAFDPAGSGGTIGAAQLVGRWPMPGQGDLTAVSWAPALPGLLLLADAEDELLVLDATGQERGRLPIGGLQQEGVALDARGDLWVAEDRGARVVRYPGALAALQDAVARGPAPESDGKKKRKKKE